MSTGIWWEQQGNRLLLHSPHELVSAAGIGGQHYFEMPTDWHLKDTHPDLLRLCEMILFPKVNKAHQWTRKQGSRIGLAFSGGVDSSAAYCLLKGLDPELFYLKRHGIHPTVMRQDNPMKVFGVNGLCVHRMHTNTELIRKPVHGFVTDYHVAVPAILLADKYDLGYIATGTMLESTYVWKGWEYRDFGKSAHWRRWSTTLALAGLTMFMPVAPLSEILTNKVVEQCGFQAESCIRGDGSPCLQCYKCWRKQAIRGVAAEQSNETKKNLTKTPPKQISSVIHANNKFGLGIPQLKQYEHMDLSWLEQYYEPAIGLAPRIFQGYLEGELRKYAEPMDTDDIERFSLV
jgi:hypothetical protein